MGLWHLLFLGCNSASNILPTTLVFRFVLWSLYLKIAIAASSVTIETMGLSRGSKFTTLNKRLKFVYDRPLAPSLLRCMFYCMGILILSFVGAFPHVFGNQPVFSIICMLSNLMLEYKWQCISWARLADFSTCPTISLQVIISSFILCQPVVVLLVLVVVQVFEWGSSILDLMFAFDKMLIRLKFALFP